ncbi:hypothetical protein BASA83_008474 [Batrachochytrium salamandrivorans]|nr:hypothetical protein BASA83_008474 [Batrachochytrium salamandrivorans]
MLSRLIVTFLCAAAIGSVSGAFLTFDPAPVVFEDIEAPISISAKLNSKPAGEVAVHLEHPFMFMSTCVIVFNPDNWDVPQQLTAIPAPLSEVETFDEMFLPFNKPGWYQMASTRDIEVQVFMNKCTEELSCPTKVLARYGSSVMIMDLLNNDGIVSLRVDLIMVAGYSSSRGLCSIPRPFSLRNKLVGPDETHRQKPVIPVPPPPTTTTTTTTMDFSTHVLSFTVDLSESTLSPTITYVLSSTTITTSPSTTSTTSPYPPYPSYPGGYVPPPPPAPGGYVPPPPPPSSQPDVVVEIQRFPKPAKI